MFPMNSLIRNCRGVGGKNFSSIVNDILRIYHIDFLAVLEPQVSGATAEAVLKKIGLQENTRVEVHGFSGGI